MDFNSCNLSKGVSKVKKLFPKRVTFVLNNAWWWYIRWCVVALQAMLTNDGLVYACGTFRDANGSIGLTESGPQKETVHLPCDKRIVKIVSGSDHILALSEEGFIYSAGSYRNKYYVGQLCCRL